MCLDDYTSVNICVGNNKNVMWVYIGLANHRPMIMIRIPNQNLLKIHLHPDKGRM